MRTRNIRPPFWKDEDLADLPFEYRLLFIGLWGLADVMGRLEDRPKMIKADVFPYDSVDVLDGISKLEGIGKLKRYEVDGRKLIWIPKLRKHQIFASKEKDTGSSLPTHPEDSDDPGSSAERPGVVRKTTRGQTRVIRPERRGPDGRRTTSRRTTDDGDPGVVDRVLSRLNEIRGTPGTGFRESPDLLARIREGRSVEDLLLVVETQAPKLLAFEGGKYFRPATLFGPKNFQRYLDEAKAGPARPTSGESLPPEAEGYYR